MINSSIYFMRNPGQVKIQLYTTSFNQKSLLLNESAGRQTLRAQLELRSAAFHWNHRTDSPGRRRQAGQLRFHSSLPPAFYAFQ